MARMSRTRWTANREVLFTVSELLSTGDLFLNGVLELRDGGFGSEDAAEGEVFGFAGLVGDEDLEGDRRLRLEVGAADSVDERTELGVLANVGLVGGSLGDLFREG